jgi:conjugative transposon TraN protein
MRPFLNHVTARGILAVILSLSLIDSFGQQVTKPQNIEVTFNKTSSIVFASAITAVDRGARDILAQKVKGVNNILQLKAGRVNFRETNLTVITSDGKLHHFFIRYAERPETFTIQADDITDVNERMTAPVIFNDEMTTDQMQQAAEKIISTSHSKVKATSGNQMKLTLRGIYILDNTMFYHLSISNYSNIPFHTDILRFYVKDRKKTKRTASQEVEETPVYRYGNPFVIKGQSTEELVYALPKFTIPDAKTLHLELMERNGGRHLSLKVRNKSIIKAKQTPAD